MKKPIAIAILSILLLAVSCSQSKEDAAVVSPPVVYASLQEMLPFKFGESVNPNRLRNNTVYSGIAAKECNSITPENAMKFNSLHPAENSYTWTDADYIVNFAQTNGAKRIHGHTLVWFQALPDWVKNNTGDAQVFENIMKTHIQTVVAHFKGKVTSWDVVNEAFNDDGSLRDNIWKQKLGDDYIARAFQYAYEADPNALLFYNDYGQEYAPAKRTAIANMVANLKSRGIRIDGIGLQFHLILSQSETNISNAINWAASTGLLVHISELDISLNKDKAQNFSPTQDLLEQQAAKYGYVVKTYNTAVPKAQKFGITTWNVGDADSWIPSYQGAPDAPLPFDVNYNRKPAYYAIIDAVK